MEKRKAITKEKFLEKRGLTKVPKGKEIDHKIPLKDGGKDSLRNLQLIKRSVHKKKTIAEAKRRNR